MEPKKNLTAIKFLVLSMGFVLVGGVILLAGLVWKKVSHDLSGLSPCAPAPVDLKGRGEVVQTSVKNGQLTLVLTRKEGGLEVVTVDLCSGKTAFTLIIEADTALRK